MNQNKKLLASFTTYCKTHPEERFWQALRNWSGRAFIVAWDNYIEWPITAANNKNGNDTFFSTKQNGT